MDDEPRTPAGTPDYGMEPGDDGATDASRVPRVVPREIATRAFSEHSARVWTVVAGVVALVALAVSLLQPGSPVGPDTQHPASPVPVSPNAVPSSMPPAPDPLDPKSSASVISPTHPIMTGTLTKVDLVVRNTTAYPDPTRIEVTLTNQGPSLVVVNRVVVKVQSVEPVDACPVAASLLSISGTYDMVLDAASKVGSSYRIPVSQQLAAGEADRFAVDIGGGKGTTASSVVFYRLSVSVESTASTQPLPVGAALLSVPTVPAARGEGAGDFYWGTAEQSDGDPNPDMLPGEVAQVHECKHANSEALRRILSTAGERSPALAELRADLR